LFDFIFEFIAEIVAEGFLELIGSLFSGAFRDSAVTLASNSLVFPALKQ